MGVEVPYFLKYSIQKMRVYHNLKLEFRVKTSLKKKQRYDIQKKKQKTFQETHLDPHLIKCESKGPKKSTLRLETQI